MSFRLPSDSHLQQLRQKSGLAVVLMGSHEQAVGIVYAQSRRLYLEPNSFTEPLIDPAPDSWGAKLSSCDRFELLKRRDERGTHAVEDLEIFARTCRRIN